MPVSEGKRGYQVREVNVRVRLLAVVPEWAEPAMSGRDVATAVQAALAGKLLDELHGKDILGETLVFLGAELESDTEIPVMPLEAPEKPVAAPQAPEKGEGAGEKGEELVEAPVEPEESGEAHDPDGLELIEGGRGHAREWTPRELALLHQHFPYGGADAAGRELRRRGFQRTDNAVYSRARQEGLVERRKPLTPLAREMLTAMVELGGMTTAELQGWTEPRSKDAMYYALRELERRGFASKSLIKGARSAPYLWKATDAGREVMRSRQENGEQEVASV